MLQFSVSTNKKTSGVVRRRAALCFAFSVLLLSILGCGGSSASSEPDNFRGLKWGAEIGALKGYDEIASDGDLAFYEKQGEASQLEDVTLEKVVYGFSKGRFYTVMIYFPAAKFIRMKEITAAKLGEPSMPDNTPSKFVWDSSNLTVLLTSTEGSETARLAYIYKPIQLEIELKK